MPIYEYECKKCGCHFDVLQSFSDPPVKTCESDGCRGRVRKVMSPPTIIFKGSGFYTTDYARGGNNSGAPKKKSEEKEAASASTSSSDSKDSSKDD